MLASLQFRQVFRVASVDQVELEHELARVTKKAARRRNAVQLRQRSRLRFLRAASALSYAACSSPKTDRSGRGAPRCR